MPSTSTRVPCLGCSKPLPSYQAASRGCPHCGRRSYFYQYRRRWGKCANCGAECQDKFRCDECQRVRSLQNEITLSDPVARAAAQKKWRDQSRRYRAKRPAANGEKPA